MSRAVLLTLCLFAAPLFCNRPASADDKPVLIVFDFTSSWDKGKMGRKIAGVFRERVFRRGGFITLEQISFEECMEQSGQTVSNATPADKVSALLHDVFQGDIAIWGEVRRNNPDDYTLHVRILDRRKDPANAALDQEYQSTLHGIALVMVDRALDQFMGVTLETGRDLLKENETGWRERQNLVQNGDFELGDASPENWERVDGLGIFWVDGVSPTGKCIRFDTMVEEPQYKKWREVFDKGAAATSAPVKIPPKPPYYSTIGGTVGAHIYSDPVPIKQGTTYRVDLDYIGKKGETKVFVKGYAPFFKKDGEVDYREVYRSQINLYPESGGREWEHAARIIHPTQPFFMLTIRSDFDGNKTGDALRTLLADKLVEYGVNPMGDLADTRARLKGHEHILTYDASKYPVAQMVRNVFERGVIVWGEIERADGQLKVRLRSLDVREAAGTKDWWQEYTLAPATLKTEGERIAREILVNARLVTFLRVKLDAYWPAGLYHFDNIWITEEPVEAE